MSEYGIFLIMRSDLASMTKGRAVAQGSHATSLFEDDLNDEDHLLHSEYKEWKGEAQGFGTAIVYGTGIETLEDIFERLHEAAKKEYEVIQMSIVVDPNYAVRDGDFTHFVNINTCMYVFAKFDWMKKNVNLSWY